MSEVLKKIRDFMEKEGIPGRDAHDLPTSLKAFPDGANYRIEIAGVERASTMEAMIAEANRRGIVVHRAIAAVGGSTYCKFEELKAMAAMAHEAKIEVIMTVGHRKGWDVGSKEIATPEGCMQGFRLRGSDHISYHIADIMRSIEAGFRGFLVYDEGVLYLLNKMRAEGLIPPETIFKCSVFGGYCSAAGAKVVASMGVNSLNPSSDVSLAILGGIRKAVDIPLDAFPNIKRLGMSSWNLAKFLVKEHKVALVPGSIFGRNGEGYLRLPFAASSEQLTEGLSRIKAGVTKIYKP